jgi:hypothetical protein
VTGGVFGEEVCGKASGMRIKNKTKARQEDCFVHLR